MELQKFYETYFPRTVRSIGWAPLRTRPRRLYFRVGLSNPTSGAKKDSIVDTISAMEFCFIYDKSAILCPGKTEVADFVSFKGSIVQGKPNIGMQKHNASPLCI